MSTIRPYEFAIPEVALDDLKMRLRHTRWPERETPDDWSQGVPLAYVKEVCEYWANDYDWRRCEALLNYWPQYHTEIDGLDIQFMHVRSPVENAMPMVMTHGWPGSIVEFLNIIDRLAHPEDHGGDPLDAFDVIAPSLPGYGFSGPPIREDGTTGPIGPRDIAQLQSAHGNGRKTNHRGSGRTGSTRRARSQSDSHAGYLCASYFSGKKL